MSADDVDAAIARNYDRYTLERPRSRELDVAARKVMPGGNTRSVLHFDPFPFRVARAEGARIVDVDGIEYIDFCGNYTAGLLGHSPPAVKQAVRAVLEEGWAIGATHAREVELAELVCGRFSSIEQVRFTNSGTEANLMAIGAALHHTGCSGVGVFEGGYHGGVLSFGAGANPLNVPHRFVVAPFGDVAGLDSLFADSDLGCVVVEPVQGAGGCVPASLEFLRELRARCDGRGVVLIFDEVMTSRLAPGGAQERFGVFPDMTTLGKYLGGGMTFGAFGGHASIMAAFDPDQGGMLTQAGTFNNNVVTMAAAIATLREVLDDDAVRAVNARGDGLAVDLAQVFHSAGLPMRVSGVGSMLNVHADDERLRELFFHEMLARGYFAARRGFMSLSLAIDDAMISGLLASVGDWARDPFSTAA